MLKSGRGWSSTTDTPLIKKSLYLLTGMILQVRVSQEKPSWWLNHPFEKYARQNMSKWVHLPQFSGWTLKKYVSCHHPVPIFYISQVVHVVYWVEKLVFLNFWAKLFLLKGTGKKHENYKKLTNPTPPKKKNTQATSSDKSSPVITWKEIWIETISKGGGSGSPGSIVSRWCLS